MIGAMRLRMAPFLWVLLAGYLLIEGDIGEGKSNARETWQRETFEVQDGKWRLVSVDDSTPAQPGAT
jgi:hypothetical protein